jgi:phage antirepressor YoqD-like protein
MNTQELTDVMQNAVQTISTLTKVIEDMRPNAEFGQAMIDDGVNKTIAQAAQEIADELYKRKGIKIGSVRLFAFLRRKGILLSSKARWNEPSQQYVDNDCFVVKSKHTPIGIKSVTLITGKGLEFVFRKVMEGYNEAELYNN